METIVTKKCSTCKSVLPVMFFNNNRTKKDGRQSECKSCLKKHAKRWREKNSEKIKNYQRKRSFGVDETMYREMFLRQEGKCAICKREKSVFCVDHNHETGEVRGLLCRKCNVGIGMFEDNTEVITSAIGYLINNNRKDKQNDWKPE